MNIRKQGASDRKGADMRTKDPELMKQILEYIEDYYIDHNASPSTTRIAEQMGIGRGTAHKYLVEMDERGMLSYQGRKITTERTEKMHTSTFRATFLAGSDNCTATVRANPSG